DAEGPAFAQRFDSAGQPIGDVIPLPFVPDDVAYGGTGVFVIVDGTTAQMFGDEGLPVGQEIDLDPTPLPDLVTGNSSVAMDAEGDFVVTWQARSPYGGDSDVYAQRVSALGELEGDRFQVNTTTDNEHLSPEVAMNADGDFVVA